MTPLSPGAPSDPRLPSETTSPSTPGSPGGPGQGEAHGTNSVSKLDDLVNQDTDNCIVTNGKLNANLFVQDPLELHVPLSALLVQYFQYLRRHRIGPGNLTKYR